MSFVPQQLLVNKMNKVGKRLTMYMIVHTFDFVYNVWHQ